MRLFSLILSLFTCCISMAQDIKMHDGKVLVNNNPYCLYEQDGNKAPVLEISNVSSIIKDNPDISGSDFHNYIFSTPDGEQSIFVIAKVLAATDNAFLQYYYCIRFPQLAKEINITYHPYLVEYLAKDIVKYDVFSDGHWNEGGAEKLASAWEKKISVISDKSIASGESRFYNVSPILSPEEENNTSIKVSHQKIYVSDTLFGSYELSTNIKAIGVRGSAKDDRLYIIYDTHHNELGAFRVPMLRSSVFFLPSGKKDYIEILTAQRNEAILIRLAVKILLAVK